MDEVDSGNMMERSPRVSVIVPNYNHARFLRTRLESVTEQTFRDTEIIYLDDASSDGSDAVFREFANDPRITAHYNTKNTGNSFVQWNKGVRLAQGEYVWIAEADDYADKTFLEKVVALLDAHPAAGIEYAPSYEVDEKDAVIDSGELYTVKLDEERWRKPFVANGKEECTRYMYVKNTIPNASAVVFRKKIYDTAGGADESYRLCGDWLLWVSMLMQSDIAYIPEHLNYFRQHAGSVRSAVTKQGRHYEELLKVRRYIQSAAPVDLARIVEENRTIAGRTARMLFRGWISVSQAFRIARQGAKVYARFPWHLIVAMMQLTGKRIKGQNREDAVSGAYPLEGEER